MLLLLLFPFPHFFLITLTYVWPKVTAGLHKQHFPYKFCRGQGCCKVLLPPLLFPVPRWMLPSLGLHSIRLFVWLRSELDLQNDLALKKKIPETGNKQTTCLWGQSSAGALGHCVSLAAAAGEPSLPVQVLKCSCQL